MIASGFLRMTASCEARALETAGACWYYPRAFGLCKGATRSILTKFVFKFCYKWEFLPRRCCGDIMSGASAALEELVGCASFLCHASAALSTPARVFRRCAQRLLWHRMQVANVEARRSSAYALDKPLAIADAACARPPPTLLSSNRVGRHERRAQHRGECPRALLLCRRVPWRTVAR